ncbi:MAG: arylsulfatase [Phycisphaerales bacterium]|jgi:arylsulfatase A|nr:arylsulfatase [Phycisphaerales bacterium]MBT7171001.1 arylsulfatase [Phycisphaerales bacterium]
MKRRTFMKNVALTTAAVAVGCNDVTAEKATVKPARKPNIIFILADDLGYAELGCYGQKKIKTPNIDRLCKAGMKFSDAYSGHAVCAPSRCTLMTGLHTGHSYVRGNLGTAYAGQLDLPLDTVTVAKLLKQVGYATACCGKWGLGGPGTDGVPWKQGFDEFFGYLDQWRAHTYYSPYLYHNEKQVPQKNGKELILHEKIKSPLKTEKSYFDRYGGNEYCTTGMIRTALNFINTNKEDPFFLYYATPIPHVSIQAPQKDYKEYKGKFNDKPYLGTKGYLPHPQPRAGYAAMVSHMDRNVGKIMDLVAELGLDDNTLIIFTSDNGPTFNGGSDSTFFESTPFRGLKCSLWEGGIRVPFIATWKGKIKAGSSSDLPVALWDMMPTFLDAIGETALIPEGIDGLSILPTLTGKGTQEIHDHLYWESGTTKAVRMGEWKGYSVVEKKTQQRRLYLFNLATDPKESKDVAEANPKVAAKIAKIMIEGRTDSPYFTMGKPSPAKAEWMKKARARAKRLKNGEKL